MSAYVNGAWATDGGQVVEINADDSTGRRSRAAQIGAVKREYERDPGVTLQLDGKSYDEAVGFLARSSFRYKIAR